MNNKIAFFESNCNIEASSIWLAAVLQFADKVGFLKAFDSFKLKMKAREYTVQQSC